MKASRLWITPVLTFVFVFSAASPALGAPGSPGPVDGVRVWVNYGPGHGPQLRRTLGIASATFHYDFPDLQAYVVTLSAAELSSIQNNPDVLYVEEDAERYPIANVRSGASMEGLATLDVRGQVVPYGIDMVQARDVWDINRDGAVDAGAPTGNGRTVCIIDTGYYQAHEDLPNALDGYSQVDDNWARDGYGHGTHVGGTIAAENNGVGVVGVSPGMVGIYIVKIFDDNGAWTYASNLVNALNSCRNAGANVVSMSMGGASYVSNENSAFANAYAAGVLSVAAAGNAGTTAYSYPASYPSVVSVAAVAANKAVAYYSQKNDQVELAAPGLGVLSTVPLNGYEAWSGTSMATPHVSGVATLVWSANPAWSNVQIREALAASALDLGPAGRDTAYGHGLVQAAAALAHLNGTAPENTPPSVTISGPEDGASFAHGALVALAATADDAEDGDLCASIVWKEGAVIQGTGAAITISTLAAGEHTLTASVTDAGGLSTSDSVTLTVAPPLIPALAAGVTTDRATYTTPQAVTITVTVGDPENAPVTGADVTVEVQCPLGAPATLAGITGPTGMATLSYWIDSRKTGAGTYTVSVTATKEGHAPSSAAATFWCAEGHFQYLPLMTKLPLP